jgi:hypothetical protein
MGDLVAFDSASVADFESTCFSGGYTLFFHPELAEGAAQSAGANGVCGFMVDATVEPDVDADGFGDETQDRCPGVAGPVEGCPAGSAPTPTPLPTPTPTPPSNAFRLGKLTRNLKRGTATLVAIVPGPGTLTLTGSGLRPQSITAAGAGAVSLPLLARGAARKRLAKKGKAPVSLVVSFTPSGGLAASLSRRAVLRRAIARAPGRSH